MSWKQTRTGKAFNLINPTPEMVDWHDVAFSLASICRFGGHCKVHYSVADHSVRVAALLPETIRIHGLLHDAKEYIVGDICSPVKKYVGDAFKALENRVQDAIYEAAGIPFPDAYTRAAIKFADLTMLATEKRDLMEASPMAWDHEPDIRPLSDIILPMGRVEARCIWLGRFRDELELFKSRA